MMSKPANRRDLLIVAPILVLIVAGMIYIGTREGALSRESPPEKLAIVIPVLPHFLLLYVAAAKGFYADEGLAVSVLPVAYGSVAIREVLEGHADVAGAAEPPFVVSLLQSAALTAVASVASISSDNTIVARRDHAIATAQDLKQKKIGLTFGTSGSYFLWTLLIRNKLPLDSIVRVDLPPDRLAAALADGSVDAISAWEPISYEAQAALGSNAVSFTEADTYTTTILAVGRGEFVKRHADAMERLVRAWLKAEQFMRLHPEETLKLAVAWLNLEPGTPQPAWSGFDFRVNLLQSQLNAMEDESRWAMTLGHAAKGPVPNFLPNLYLDALLAVRPDRVTVLH
jgi:ABC-type nitrate/sulfonate/bicarbonate transport system substrate-binding protein